ncbi:hypothetical protein GCM10009682_16340 [Luedemannella flava]|uniref:Uncharacterized protein n=1 Tax=Luedemannella flava TaxID=349316 RepID=A0ABP4Y0K6_9ACTN
MPIGPQPRGARGTVGHPYSALHLRLVLALFGLVLCVLGAIWCLGEGFTGFGIVLVALAAVTIVDLVVITLRLRAGRR